MRSHHSILLIITILFMGCLKEETPVAPPPPSQLESIEITMGADYRNQVFFDLSSSQVTATNLKTEWDLAFSSSIGEHQVFLNSSKSMRACKLDIENISIENPDFETLDWTFDAPSGNLDSTAIGNWVDENAVFAINRGKNWLGEHQGYALLKILSVNSSEFQIEFRKEFDSDTHTLQVNKDSNLAFQCFSFDQLGSVVDIQPDKHNWDLLFTQYLEVLHSDDEPISYLVTGVILNNGLTKAYKAEYESFSELTIEDIENLDFSSDINVIGFDWKVFDFENGFEVIPGNTYVLRDTSGNYYKLQFTDFHNEFGVKGHPNFEIQKL